MDVASEEAPASAVTVVENATLDLDVFGTLYNGTTKERRLAFIAKRCPALRLDALRMLVAGLGTSQRPQDHYTYAMQLAEASVMAGLEPPAVPTEAGVKEALAKNTATLERLEAEHKKNKSFMVKETIRLGFTELGDHLFATGGYSAALKQYTRCRDYSTASKHVVEMCFNVIKVAIELNNWVLVQSYISKAESTYGAPPSAQSGSADPDAKLRAKTHCCSGLALMAAHDFAGAARAFLQVKFDYSSDFPELMAARDVGVYGGLCKKKEKKHYAVLCGQSRRRGECIDWLQAGALRNQVGNKRADDVLQPSAPRQCAKQAVSQPSGAAQLCYVPLLDYHTRYKFTS